MYVIIGFPQIFSPVWKQVLHLLRLKTKSFFGRALVFFGSIRQWAFSVLYSSTAVLIWSQGHANTGLQNANSPRHGWDACSIPPEKPRLRQLRSLPKAWPRSHRTARLLVCTLIRHCLFLRFLFRLFRIISTFSTSFLLFFLSFHKIKSLPPNPWKPWFYR